MATRVSGSPRVKARRSCSAPPMREQQSHSSRWAPAPSSRCRRRSPADSARSTGRHRSPVGSTCSWTSRYSTRSLARTRPSWAATAPGVEPRRSASVRVSWWCTSWATSRSRSAAGSRASAAATSAVSSCRSSTSPGGSAASTSASRCVLLRARSLRRAKVATTLRAVTAAYGASVSLSTRDRAAITRARVSWTRSSTTWGFRIRDLMIFCTSGTRSTIVSSPGAGRWRASDTDTLHIRTLVRGRGHCGHRRAYMCRGSARPCMPPPSPGPATEVAAVRPGRLPEEPRMTRAPVPATLSRGRSGRQPPLPPSAWPGSR